MKSLGKFAVLLAVVMAGCGEREVPLAGERLSVRTPVGALRSVGPATARMTPVRLPAPRSIGEWSHRGGSAEHTAPHAALSPEPRLVWSVDIGEAETRRNRITADPVSDGARIFTIDASARLTAVTTAGRIAWTADLTPASEAAGLASGGALAVSGGVVYATTTYGTLSAFQAATGALIWQQRLDAVPSGPPTVRGDVVYFVTRDNRAWALETATGRIRWQLSGIPATAGYSNGAGPAVSDAVAVFPFSSGELMAVLRQGGVRLWSGAVSGARVGRVYAAIPDFASDPVISGSRVFAATQSGRMVAYEINTGERLWTAQTGATGPLLAAGGALWFISDDGRLTRAEAATGRTVWSQPLPYFTEEKVRRRKGIHAQFGPVLAGGRLLVASSEGVLRAFDPSTGAHLGTTPLPDGAVAAPIVVGGTLYIVTSGGALHALR